MLAANPNARECRVTVARSVFALACAATVAASVSACSSKKSNTGASTTPSSSATTSGAPITLTPPPSSQPPAGTFFGVDRLFTAKDEDRCTVIDLGKLKAAVGMDLQAGTTEGSSACVFSTADRSGQVIVTVDIGMPALALDEKLKLNGVGNVTAKEVTVAGAKRAVLETQSLPSQVNQTIIALFDAGGLQLLISGKNLTDGNAISAAQAVAGTA